MTLIHISRVIPQENEAVKAYLAGLDKYQLRYLKRWGCGFCDASLAGSFCGAIQWDGLVTACSEDKRIQQREECLQNYRPRPARRKA